jgi:hypothetical protein
VSFASTLNTDAKPPASIGDKIARRLMDIEREQESPRPRLLRAT